MTQISSSRLNKIFGLLLATAAASAQTMPSLDDYRKSCNNCNELVLSDKCAYDISVEKGRLHVIQDNYYESIILSETGILNNNERFSYSDLVKLKEYDAFSVISDRGKERKVKVTQINETLRDNSAVFYDDVKESQLVFPNLQIGAKKVYSVKKEFSDPFLLQGYFFGDGNATKEATFEVLADKNIGIGYKIFNDPDNKIAFSRTEKKGKWLYRWVLNDVKSIKFEPNNPGYRYFLPHIDAYVTDYDTGKEKVSVLGDTDRLYTYYKSFVKTLNKADDATLMETTKAIIAGSTSDTEKVKKIFYWVKDNVKYLAFENGYEGFIPREAGLVCQRKFGDCKDMANLITTMCSYAGVKGVSLCWIGTREIPYGYSKLSTPAVDNHMIAVYDDNGKNIFLDATDTQTKYGIPTAFIQDKEALISHGETYLIATVPVTPAEVNKIESRMDVKLDREKITGSGTMAFSGYSRSRRLEQFGDASGKERREMIRQLAEVGSNKFNLQDYKEINLDNRDLPYQVDYSFDIRDYALTIDNDIYVNLVPDPVFQKNDIEVDRVTSYDFDYLVAYDGQLSLEIPKGMKVRTLPDGLQLDNDLLKASIQYKKTATNVEVHLEIATKKILIEKEDFKLWNETIQQLKDNYAQTLILTKI